MPSWHRDPAAVAPNRPRKVGVCFIIELDGGLLMAQLALTPVHQEISDVYLAGGAEIVIA